MRFWIVSIAAHLFILAMMIFLNVNSLVNKTNEFNPIKTVPIKILLKSETKLYTYKGTQSRFQNSSKQLGNSKNRQDKVKKLFSLAPSQGPVLASPISTNHQGKVYRFSGEGHSNDGGRFTYRVYGSGASHSFWTLLSRDLDERLNFIHPLYRLGNEGKISVSLNFKEDGALDESSVTSLGDQRYLKVYTLREICQVWCFANAQKATLIAQSDESVKLLITVAYLSGTHERFNKNPSPIVAHNKIMLERYRKTALRIGEMDVTAESDESGESNAKFSFNFELESLVSAEHRKRYGMSGTKQIQARFRSLKLELEKLAEEYESRGWI